MKRSGFKPRTTPMARGAGLSRGTATLSRSSTLSRKTRIKPQSAKAKAKAELRSAFVKALLTKRPECQARIVEAACTFFADDVHEKMTRASGGDILDEDNCICVCRRCHDFIHDNRKRAEAMGLLDSRYPGRDERTDG